MNLSITIDDLRERNVLFADDTTKELLPYTFLCPEEFDIIHDIFAGMNNSRLAISIGKGITYHLWHNSKHGGFLEATLRAHADCFIFPLEISVTASHEPEKPEEHSDFCPYSYQEWPKDEDGNSYWAEPEDCKYEEENDTWSAPENKRHYDVDCNCDYVEDETKTFTIKDYPDLEPLRAYLREAWEKLP